MCKQEDTRGSETGEVYRWALFYPQQSDALALMLALLNLACLFCVGTACAGLSDRSPSLPSSDMLTNVTAEMSHSQYHPRPHNSMRLTDNSCCELCLVKLGWSCLLACPPTGA